MGNYIEDKLYKRKVIYKERGYKLKLYKTKYIENRKQS